MKLSFMNFLQVTLAYSTLKVAVWIYNLKLIAEKSVMRAYSVPGSVLRVSHAFTITIEQASQADMSGNSGILTLTTGTRAQFLTTHDTWSKIAHAFNKIRIEFMEVILVITVPSKCSCFLTLFVSVPPLSTKLRAWGLNSYPTLLSFTHKHKKQWLVLKLVSLI